VVSEGILLVNKPRGNTSFSIVAALRRLLGVATIGHTGTLDPFATGLLVILIGRKYTRLSQQLLNGDKSYSAQLLLGVDTETYDCDGKVTGRSSHQPPLQQVEEALTHFQGDVEQIPPMFSAKKIQGRRLYQLARQGITVERQPQKVSLATELVHYGYPEMQLTVRCSKGTYIRSIAHDLGRRLGCGAHLTALMRLTCGSFSLHQALDGELLFHPGAVTHSLLADSLVLMPSL